jgi:hypothetical protein
MWQAGGRQALEKRVGEPGAGISKFCHRTVGWQRVKPIGCRAIKYYFIYILRYSCGILGAAIVLLADKLTPVFFLADGEISGTKQQWTPLVCARAVLPSTFLTLKTRFAFRFLLRFAFPGTRVTGVAFVVNVYQRRSMACTDLPIIRRFKITAVAARCLGGV